MRDQDNWHPGTQRGIALYRAGYNTHTTRTPAALSGAQCMVGTWSVPSPNYRLSRPTGGLPQVGGSPLTRSPAACRALGARSPESGVRYGSPTPLAITHVRAASMGVPLGGPAPADASTLARAAARAPRSPAGVRRWRCRATPARPRRPPALAARPSSPPARPPARV